MPVIRHLLESALYVDDMDTVVSFYRRVFGFWVLDEGERLVALAAGGSSVLLIFKRGRTVEGATLPGGWIPPHDGSGPVHLAFAIESNALAEWEQHLESHGVAIESRVTWDAGGHSIYVRDPAGHSVELATQGTWAVY
jgi:catechol-2,3-dioxygenase